MEKPFGGTAVAFEKNSERTPHVIHSPPLPLSLTSGPFSGLSTAPPHLPCSSSSLSTASRWWARRGVPRPEEEEEEGHRRRLGEEEEERRHRRLGEEEEVHLRWRLGEEGRRGWERRRKQELRGSGFCTEEKSAFAQSTYELGSLLIDF
ncbi:hypothetical protein SETIT_4G025800v2 [Setaria italica]|uniref:Uncharacterized protein n=1 Tax=Setaria italica TaxID=4555 RepID=A0A368QQN4_SETIT|nr:hypothetical protein SETIT_4G025800v2 [Setaria italica]